MAKARPYLHKKNVSDDEKAEIALKLTKIKSPKNYSCGYPMPVPLAQLTIEAGLALKLSDFVDNESLFMFDVLAFKKDWLDKPVQTWKNYESYLEMENWVRNLKVTNDTAERGVKLVSDFSKILTKELDPGVKSPKLPISSPARTSLGKTLIDSSKEKLQPQIQ